MKPIKTEKTTGTYGAPAGLEEAVGGLPFYREEVTLGGFPTREVMSVWAFSDSERAAIAQGANVMLGIVGEPIPPVSLSLTDQVELVAEPQQVPA